MVKKQCKDTIYSEIFVSLQDKKTKRDLNKKT